MDSFDERRRGRQLLLDSFPGDDEAAVVEEDRLSCGGLDLEARRAVAPSLPIIDGSIVEGGMRR